MCDCGRRLRRVIAEKWQVCRMQVTCAHRTVRPHRSLEIRAGAHQGHFPFFPFLPRMLPARKRTRLSRDKDKDNPGHAHPICWTLEFGCTDATSQNRRTYPGSWVRPYCEAEQCGRTVRSPCFDLPLLQRTVRLRPRSRRHICDMACCETPPLLAIMSQWQAASSHCSSTQKTDAFPAECRFGRDHRR